MKPIYRAMRAAGVTARRLRARLDDALARRLATRRRPEVVFLGDSITEFWSDEDPALFGWHRINRGVRGHTTKELLARFEHDVLAWRPRAVHIMGGTNDLWFGDPGPGAETSLAAIRAMVAAAHAAGIVPILAAPAPIAKNALPLFAHADLQGSLTQGIVEIARTERLVLVEYAMSLCDEAGVLRPRFTTDGVHLTRAGYRAMRDQAARAIREAIRRPS